MFRQRGTGRVGLGRVVSWAVMGVLLSATGVVAGDTTPVAVNEQELAAKLKALPAGPLLVLPRGGEERIREFVGRNEVMASLSARNIAHADAVLAMPVLERKPVGKRQILLDVSRDGLGRMLLLGYAYRMTGESKYAEKARAEMKAICGFSDFNPSHFLDVAEMTTALSIGLDWFGGVMPESERQAVRDAIVNKGLRPSLSPPDSFWVKGTNNWNQVCHGGMVMGALAVGREEPELAAKIIARAVESVPLALKQYGPDGAYPEGPSYWDFGTTYSVLMMSSLQSALGTDYGLSKMPGFLRSGVYLLHVTGPTRNWFNYSDNSQRWPSQASPAMYWIAGQLGDSSLPYHDNLALRSAMEQKQIPTNQWRGAFNVMLICWSDGSTPADPKQLSYVGQGETPVGLFRTGWGREATWAGIKGGAASVSHAHMDAGQFVVEALGRRWVEDLGLQEYRSLENKGVDLWNGGQDSERWSIYRLGPNSHAILTLDGDRLAVKGVAKLTKSGDDFALLDTSAIYGGKATRALRGLRLDQEQGTVRVRDEFTTASNAKARWAFPTRAKVTVLGDNLLLEQNGRKLAVQGRRDGATKVQWTVAEAKGTHPADEANPGVSMVTAEFETKAGVEHWIDVAFVPLTGSGSVEQLPESTIRRLEEWGR